MVAEKLCLPWVNASPFGSFSILSMNGHKLFNESRFTPARGEYWTFVISSQCGASFDLQRILIVPLPTGVT